MRRLLRSPSLAFASSHRRAAATAGAADAAAPRVEPRYRRLDQADSRHRCPCCGNDVRGRTARQHLGKCAPDVHAFILQAGAWPAQPHDAFAAAEQGEVASLLRLKQLRFREGLPWEAAAELMGVPVQRLRGLLRRDSQKIELVRDPEALEVLHEDADLLVVAKPPDLRAHPIHRFQGGSLLNRAANHVPIGAPVPAVVHRLDQDTSGVMVFVKNRAMAAAVSQQFAHKTVEKDYLALCLGVPPAACFVVDAPIARHPAHAPARMLAIGGKPARTRCRVLAWRPPIGDRPACALVRAAPETGRTHQIRLHLAGAGLPIVLDPFYGPSGEELQAACGTAWPLDVAMTRQALHAAGLRLQHPRDGGSVHFQAPLPQDMRLLGAALGLLDGSGAPRSDGCVVSDAQALVAALGGGEEAPAWLDFARGTCVPICYRDDPMATPADAQLSDASEEEEEEEEELS